MMLCFLSLCCRYWPFGPEGCQTHGVQGMVSILAGISFLGAVAWDRYHMYCTSEYRILCYIWQLYILDILYRLSNLK